MTIVLPPWTRPPAAVRVAHCAGRADADLVEAGRAALESAGFAASVAPVGPSAEAFAAQVHAPPPAIAPNLAAPDFVRARAIASAIAAPDVTALVAARGGYGAMRLIRRLPQNLLAEHPTWLVGYSDITTLHLWALAQGVASIHGPMAASLARNGDDGSLEALVATLAGDPPPLPAIPAIDGQDGDVRGRLIGGNLSLLAALRPTELWPSLDGVLLFVEEVDEPLYRIDRMLASLDLAGGLDRVAGFVVGQLRGCGRDSGAEPEQAEALARSLVIDTLSRYERPVFAGVQAGHGSPNLPFIHGGTYRFIDGHLVHVTTKSAARAVARSIQTPERVLADAVLGGITPGAQLHISTREGHATDMTTGWTAWTDDAVVASVTPDTLFDIASVTKAVSTAVLTHLAVAESLVRFDDRCPADISAGQPKLRDLLRHTSGLPAYAPVWVEAREEDDPRAFAERAFAAITPIPEQSGREVYSDVGYIALGRWVARIFDTPLPELFDSRVATPLGISEECGYGIMTDALDRVAATERCPFRGTTLQGVVHDENCQVLGGAAGHAGIFATARAVGAIARSLLGQGTRILPAHAVDTMWSLRPRVGSYTLGWDTPSGPRSNAGTLMHRDATVGHLGFTGCSLWIDRRLGLAVVLNTNRVHPSRDNAGIRWLRPAVHDAVLDALASPTT